MIRLALCLLLLSGAAQAAECDAGKVRERLYGFAPVAYGVAGERIMQVWINAQGVAYWTRLDSTGLCIVSPRIEQFKLVMPAGEQTS